MGKLIYLFSGVLQVSSAATVGVDTELREKG